MLAKNDVLVCAPLGLPNNDDAGCAFCWLARSEPPNNDELCWAKGFGLAMRTDGSAFWVDLPKGPLPKGETPDDAATGEPKALLVAGSGLLPMAEKSDKEGETLPNSKLPCIKLLGDVERHANVADAACCDEPNRPAGCGEAKSPPD